MQRLKRERERETYNSDWGEKGVQQKTRGGATENHNTISGSSREFIPLLRYTVFSEEEAFLFADVAAVSTALD